MAIAGGLVAGGVGKAGWVAAFALSPALLVMVCLVMLFVYPTLRSDVLALFSKSSSSLSMEQAEWRRRFSKALPWSMQTLR